MGRIDDAIWPGIKSLGESERDHFFTYYLALLCTIDFLSNKMSEMKMNKLMKLNNVML